MCPKSSCLLAGLILVLFVRQVLLAQSVSNNESSKEQPPHAAKSSEGIRIGVADSMTPIRRIPGDSESGQPDKTIAWQEPVSLALARNEFESAQVVIEALSGRTLQEVRITLGPLVKNGNPNRLWPAENITLWRFEDIDVYNLWEPHQSLGWFPDPLVPVNEPFAVAAGQRQRLLIRFFAAAEMPGGTYRGELTLTTADAGEKRLPIEVTVWDFLLPVEQHFTLTIPIWGGQMDKMYPGSATPQRRAAYLDMLYDHRIAPFPLEDDEVEHAIARGVRKFNLGCFDKHNVESEKANSIGKTAALWQQRGWDKMAQTFVLLGDEAPRDCYPNIQKQGQRMGELAPHVERCFTVSPEMIQDISWIHEQMNGAADTVILGAANCFPTDSLSRQVQATGFHLWWYYVASHYYIPDSSLEARQVFWRHWKYRVSGQLHWGMSYWGDANIAGQDGKKWPEIPWASNDSRSGDGYLVYPAPGGTAYYPSLRLELLRDGIEDYEYFYRLRELTDRLEKQTPDVNAARIRENRELLAIDDALVKSYSEYITKPEKYRAFRELLAQAILATQNLLLK